MGVQIPLWEGAIFGKEAPVVRYRDFLHELCKNGLTDELAVF